MIEKLASVLCVLLVLILSSLDSFARSHNIDEHQIKWNEHPDFKGDPEKAVREASKLFYLLDKRAMEQYEEVKATYPAEQVEKIFNDRAAREEIVYTSKLGKASLKLAETGERFISVFHKRSGVMFLFSMVVWEEGKRPPQEKIDRHLMTMVEYDGRQTLRKEIAKQHIDADEGKGRTTVHILIEARESWRKDTHLDVYPKEGQAGLPLLEDDGTRILLKPRAPKYSWTWLWGEYVPATVHTPEWKFGFTNGVIQGVLTAGVSGLQSILHPQEKLEFLSAGVAFMWGTGIGANTATIKAFQRRGSYTSQIIKRSTKTLLFNISILSAQAIASGPTTLAAAASSSLMAAAANIVIHKLAKIEVDVIPEFRQRVKLSEGYVDSKYPFVGGARKSTFEYEMIYNLVFYPIKLMDLTGFRVGNVPIGRIAFVTLIPGASKFNIFWLKKEKERFARLHEHEESGNHRFEHKLHEMETELYKVQRRWNQILHSYETVPIYLVSKTIDILNRGLKFMKVSEHNRFFLLKAMENSRRRMETISDRRIEQANILKHGLHKYEHALSKMSRSTHCLDLLNVLNEAGGVGFH